jgi:hypothetical protein
LDEDACSDASDDACTFDTDACNGGVTAGTFTSAAVFVGAACSDASDDACTFETDACNGGVTAGTFASTAVFVGAACSDDSADTCTFETDGTFETDACNGAVDALPFDCTGATAAIDAEADCDPTVEGTACSTEVCCVVDTTGPVITVVVSAVTNADGSDWTYDAAADPASDNPTSAATVAFLITVIDEHAAGEDPLTFGSDPAATSAVTLSAGCATPAYSVVSADHSDACLAAVSCVEYEVACTAPAAAADMVVTVVAADWGDASDNPTDADATITVHSDATPPTVTITATGDNEKTASTFTYDPEQDAAANPTSASAVTFTFTVADDDGAVGDDPLDFGSDAAATGGDGKVTVGAGCGSPVYARAASCPADAGTCVEYTVVCTAPDAPADIEVSVAAADVKNVALAIMAADVTATVRSDVTRPSVVITASGTNEAPGSDFTYDANTDAADNPTSAPTVTFTFTVGDDDDLGADPLPEDRVVIGDACTSPVYAQGACAATECVYTLECTAPVAPADMVVTVAAGSVINLGDGISADEVAATVHSDITPPTVVITASGANQLAASDFAYDANVAAAENPTSAATVTFTFTVSDDDDDVGDNPLGLDGGVAAGITIDVATCVDAVYAQTAGACSAGNSCVEYTVECTAPAAPADIVVSVAAGDGQNKAKAITAADAAATVRSDITRPSVVITGTGTNMDGSDWVYDAGVDTGTGNVANPTSSTHVTFLFTVTDDDAVGADPLEFGSCAGDGACADGDDGKVTLVKGCRNPAYAKVADADQSEACGAAVSCVEYTVVCEAPVVKANVEVKVEAGAWVNVAEGITEVESYAAVRSDPTRPTVEITAAGENQDASSFLDSCQEVNIGAGEVTDQSFLVPNWENHVCPTVINKDNWANSDTDDTTFSIVQEDAVITQVVRTDGGGDDWGMDLTIVCCVPTSAPSLVFTFKVHDDDDVGADPLPEAAITIGAGCVDPVYAKSDTPCDTDSCVEYTVGCTAPAAPADIVVSVAAGAWRNLANGLTDVPTALAVHSDITRPEVSITATGDNQDTSVFAYTAAETTEDNPTSALTITFTFTVSDSDDAVGWDPLEFGDTDDMCDGAVWAGTETECEESAGTCAGADPDIPGTTTKALCDAAATTAGTFTSSAAYDSSDADPANTAQVTLSATCVSPAYTKVGDCDVGNSCIEYTVVCTAPDTPGNIQVSVGAGVWSNEALGVTEAETAIEVRSDVTPPTLTITATAVNALTPADSLGAAHAAYATANSAAACLGYDDNGGADGGSACELNGDGSACLVAGGDCVYRHSERYKPAGDTITYTFTITDDDHVGNHDLGDEEEGYVGPLAFGMITPVGCNTAAGAAVGSGDFEGPLHCDEESPATTCKMYTMECAGLTPSSLTSMDIADCSVYNKARACVELANGGSDLAHEVYSDNTAPHVTITTASCVEANDSTDPADCASLEYSNADTVTFTFTLSDWDVATDGAGTGFSPGFVQEFVESMVTTNGNCNNPAFSGYLDDIDTADHYHAVTAVFELECDGNQGADVLSISVEVADGLFNDYAGNPNTAAAAYVLLSDTEIPQVTAVTYVSDNTHTRGVTDFTEPRWATAGNLITVEITVSEYITMPTVKVADVTLAKCDGIAVHDPDVCADADASNKIIADDACVATSDENACNAFTAYYTVAADSVEGPVWVVVKDFFDVHFDADGDFGDAGGQMLCGNPSHDTGDSALNIFDNEAGTCEGALCDGSAFVGTQAECEDSQGTCTDPISATTREDCIGDFTSTIAYSRGATAAATAAACEAAGEVFTIGPDAVTLPAATVDGLAAHIVSANQVLRIDVTQPEVACADYQFTTDPGEDFATQPCNVESTVVTEDPHNIEEGVTYTWTALGACVECAPVNSIAPFSAYSQQGQIALDHYSSDQGGRIDDLISEISNGWVKEQCQDLDLASAVQQQYDHEDTYDPCQTSRGGQGGIDHTGGCELWLIPTWDNQDDMIPAADTQFPVTPGGGADGSAGAPHALTLTAYDSAGNSNTCAFAVTVIDDENTAQPVDCATYAADLAANTDAGRPYATIQGAVATKVDTALADATDNVGQTRVHANPWDIVPEYGSGQGTDFSTIEMPVAQPGASDDDDPIIPGFWSCWIDASDVDGSGDDETMSTLRAANLMPCPFPSQIECAPVDDNSVEESPSNGAQTTQTLAEDCTLGTPGSSEAGLRCVNSDNDSDCIDYKVRFWCDTSLVSFTAFDDYGNFHTCTTTVTVQDDEAPTQTCSDAITTTSGTDVSELLDIAAFQSYTDNVETAWNEVVVTVENPTGEDAAAPSAVTYDVMPLETSMAEAMAAARTALDDWIEARPALEAPADAALAIDSSAADAEAAFFDVLNDWRAALPTVTSDNYFSETATTAQLYDGHSLLSSAENTIIHSDAYENVATCPVNIYVRDDDRPTIHCPANIITNVDHVPVACNGALSAVTAVEAVEEVICELNAQTCGGDSFDGSEIECEDTAGTCADAAPAVAGAVTRAECEDITVICELNLDEDACSDASDDACTLNAQTCGGESFDGSETECEDTAGTCADAAPAVAGAVTRAECEDITVICELNLDEDACSDGSDDACSFMDGLCNGGVTAGTFTSTAVFVADTCDGGVTAGTFTSTAVFVADACNGGVTAGTFTSTAVFVAAASACSDASDAEACTFDNGACSGAVAGVTGVEGRDEVICGLALNFDPLNPAGACSEASHESCEFAPDSYRNYATVDVGLATVTDNVNGVVDTFPELTSFGRAQKNLGWTDPDGVQFSVLRGKAEAFGIGTTTVKYYVTDSFGNEADPCTMTVTVHDNVKPTLTCPAELKFDTESGELYGIFTEALAGEIVPSDNVFGAQDNVYYPQTWTDMDNSGYVYHTMVNTDSDLAKAWWHDFQHNLIPQNTQGYEEGPGITIFHMTPDIEPGQSKKYQIVYTVWDPTCIEGVVICELNGDSSACSEASADTCTFETGACSGSYAGDRVPCAWEGGDGFGNNAMSCGTTVIITERDDCQPNPCLNGGRCVDEVADFRCECVGGFMGRNCEFDCDYWMEEDRSSDRLTYCDEAGYKFMMMSYGCVDYINFPSFEHNPADGHNFCALTDMAERCFDLMQGFYERCSYCLPRVTNYDGVELTYFGPDFEPIYNSGGVLQNPVLPLSGFDAVDWKLFSELHETQLICERPKILTTEVGCDPVSAQYAISVCETQPCSNACSAAVKTFQYACETIRDCKGHVAPRHLVGDGVCHDGARFACTDSDGESVDGPWIARGWTLPEVDPVTASHDYTFCTGLTKNAWTDTPCLDWAGTPVDAADRAACLGTESTWEPSPCIDESGEAPAAVEVEGSPVTDRSACSELEPRHVDSNVWRPTACAAAADDAGTAVHLSGTSCTMLACADPNACTSEESAVQAACQYECLVQASGHTYHLVAPESLANTWEASRGAAWRCRDADGLPTSMTKDIAALGSCQVDVECTEIATGKTFDLGYVGSGFGTCVDSEGYAVAAVTEEECLGHIELGSLTWDETQGVCTALDDSTTITTRDTCIGLGVVGHTWDDAEGDGENGEMARGFCTAPNGGPITDYYTVAHGRVTAPRVNSASGSAPLHISELSLDPMNPLGDVFPGSANVEASSPAGCLGTASGNSWAERETLTYEDPDPFYAEVFAEKGTRTVDFNCERFFYDGGGALIIVGAI